MSIVYDLFYVFIVLYPLILSRNYKWSLGKEILQSFLALTSLLLFIYIRSLLLQGITITLYHLLVIDIVLYSIMFAFPYYLIKRFLTQKLIPRFLKVGKALNIILDITLSVLVLLLLISISILIMDSGVLAFFVFLIIIYYMISYFLILNNINATVGNCFVYFAPLFTLLIVSGTVYGIVSYELSQLSDPLDKANYVAGLLSHNRWCYTDNNCLLKNIGQATDLFTWIVMGYSRCGGVAHIATDLLNQYGVEAYYAGFPGEDHFFVVVNISGRLYVIDPGSYSNAVLMEKRIIDRLKNWGGISYIVAYRDNDIIELTDKYPDILPYDTIIIQVLNNSWPVLDACVTLRHKFQTHKTTEIPGNGHCLNTNSDGEVVIHLGVPHYKDKAKIYEPFFHVYIDGKDTGITVTSTETNTAHHVAVPYPSNK